MSSLESRRHRPQRVTFRDLVTSAQSADANTRKQAWAAYQAWMQAAKDERIPQSDRLTHMQRDVLRKIFTEKGFIKPGTPDARTVPPR